MDKVKLQKLIDKTADAAEFQFCLSTLTQMFYDHYGKKAIILIDEYDVPLNHANQFGYYNEMINLIRGLFSSGMKGNDSLAFSVFTGCLRILRKVFLRG